MTSYSKDPSFIKTSLDSPITQFALPLTFYKNDVHSPGGTAIVIAPNLAITAKHVIEVDWKKFEGEKFSKVSLHGNFSMMAHQILSSGKIGALWKITRFWVAEHDDVVFLRLEPASESAKTYKWIKPRVSLAPPTIGSRIIGFGYHDCEIEIMPEGLLKWKVNPATTVGEVIDVQNNRKTPIYFVNARFENHMSGGPIFNNDGQLCGIIRSSFNEDTSSVTPLWSCMGTFIDIPRKGFEGDAPYPVLELVKGGYINAVDENDVKLIQSEDEKSVRVQLKKKNYEID